MNRISTLSQQNRSIGFVTQTQSRIADLQNQVASGQKSLDYRGIARNSDRLITMEASVVRVSQYVEDNALVERRLGTMETSVAQIFELMSEYKSVLINALNVDNANDLDLNNRATQMLAQVQALLNAEEDGRYLFAGTRTDTPPVNTSAMPASYTIPTSDADVTNDDYFVGNTNKFTLRADDNFNIQYNIDASEQGFQRTVRALDVLVKAPLTNDRPTLEHALGLVSNALNDLADIRTRVGTTRKTITEVNARHDDFTLFTEQNINDIQNVDIAEAVTRMQGAQVTLEASFLTISRLSQITLLNFLR